MSDFSKVDPVISGADYTVSTVGGQQPRTLDDFTAGETVSFVAVCGSHVTEVCGSWRIVGDTLVVHEKSEQGIGKDVRTWSISARGGGFDAVSPSVY